MPTTQGMRGPAQLICMNPFSWIPYPFFKTQFRHHRFQEAFLDTPTLPPAVATTTSTTQQMFNKYLSSERLRGISQMKENLQSPKEER